MKHYEVPSDLLKIRSLLWADPLKEFELIDDAIPEIKRGIWGEHTEILYKKLATNGFIYKKVSCSFEEWLSLLTKAEIALLDFSTSKHVISIKESSTCSYSLARDISYKGVDGTLEYDFDKCTFRLCMKKFTFYFDIPELPLNREIFNSERFMSRVRDLVSELRIA